MHINRSLLPRSPREACFTAAWALYAVWLLAAGGLYMPLAGLLLLISTPTSVAQPLLTTRTLITLFYSTSRLIGVASMDSSRTPLRAPSSSLTRRKPVSEDGSGSE